MIGAWTVLFLEQIARVDDYRQCWVLPKNWAGEVSFLLVIRHLVQGDDDYRPLSLSLFGLHSPGLGPGVFLKLTSASRGLSLAAEHGRNTNGIYRYIYTKVHIHLQRIFRRSFNSFPAKY